MNLMISILAILVAIIMGIPVWLDYLNQRRKRNSLQEGVSEFWSDFGKVFSSERNARDLSLSDMAHRIGGNISPENVHEFESGEPVPAEYLGAILDAIDFNDWEFRSLALKHLEPEKYNSYIEPLLQGGAAAENLSSARRTWSIASRYLATDIPVVAAPSSSRSQFKSLNSENYTRLDSLGDRDSIVEIVRLLSRLYPASRANLEDSSSFGVNNLRRPLVLVGGMGFEGHENNSLTKSLFNHLGIRLNFRCDGLDYTDRSWNVERREDGEVVKDIAIFSRLSSPFDDKVKIVSLQGVFTRGVLGAALSFGLGSVAQHNHRIVDELVGSGDFVAIFEVSVVGGRVIPAKVGKEDIFLIS